MASYVNQLARLPRETFSLNPGQVWHHEDDPNNLTPFYEMGQLQGDLRQFQSKFNEPIRNPDGTLSVKLQRPGGGKYDLLEVTYAQDPQSGEWVMQGQPREFRQQSSLSSGLQSLAQGGAFIGGAALGMNALGGALMGGAGTAGAGGAATGAGGAAAGGGGAGIGSVASGATGIAPSGALGSGLVGSAGTGGAAGATGLGAIGAGSTAGGVATGLGSTGLGSAAGAASGLGSLVSRGAEMFSNFKPGDWINLGGLVAAVATRPDAPDTSGINNAAQANADISQRYLDLSQRQYDDQLALFNEFKPLLMQQIQQSIASQTKSDQRSDAQWEDYLSTWRPVEQRLSQMTLDFANPARFEQEANRAASDATTQFDRARVDQRRALEMAGASQGKIATLEAAGRLAEAKGVAGAQSQARRDTEGRAMAYLDNASRFGRNMPSTGIQTAQLAGQQGAQAVGGFNNLSGAAQQPAQAAYQGLGGAMNANNSSASLFNQAAGLNMQGQVNTNNAVMGSFAGLNRWFGSSEKTKKMGPTLADAGKKVAASPAKNWSYKPGEGDGNTKARMGPTAESLAAAAPEVSDGKRVDSIAMLGLHHGAIGEHEKRLARIEKALTLADAA